MDYRKLIDEQLGDGYTFVKVYNAFENGELRIIAKDAQGCEHRYILVDGELTEKPQPKIENSREHPERGCLSCRHF